MSAPISVSVPHRLGKAEALNRLKNGIGTLKNHLQGILSFEQEVWVGDTLEFVLRGLGQTASGRIQVMDDRVQIEVVLPWLLHKFAERIVPALKKETTLLLEKK
jgi:hypothetical protein